MIDLNLTYFMNMNMILTSNLARSICIRATSVGTQTYYQKQGGYPTEKIRAAAQNRTGLCRWHPNYVSWNRELKILSLTSFWYWKSFTHNCRVGRISGDSLSDLSRLFSLRQISAVDLPFSFTQTFVAIQGILFSS